MARAQFDAQQVSTRGDAIDTRAAGAELIEGAAAAPVTANGRVTGIRTPMGEEPAGAVVVVRPDQYVAHVLPLQTREELTDFFAGILRPQREEADIAR